MPLDARVGGNSLAERNARALALLLKADSTGTMVPAAGTGSPVRALFTRFVGCSSNTYNARNTLFRWLSKVERFEGVEPAPFGLG